MLICFRVHLAMVYHHSTVHEDLRAFQVSQAGQVYQAEMVSLDHLGLLGHQDLMAYLGYQGSLVQPYQENVERVVSVPDRQTDKQMDGERLGRWVPA